MNRRPRPAPPAPAPEGGRLPAAPELQDWRRRLASRRAFLIAAAGGLAALFAPPARAAAFDPWPVLEAALDHLFPSEPQAPGAREIRALDYLRRVIADPRGDREEQRFLIQGAGWLDGLARKRQGAPFVGLDAARKERTLREAAASEKGENWVSTLLVYLCEALLADPIHGGNPDGIGWRWLQHQPGFPRPTRLPAPRNAQRGSI